MSIETSSTPPPKTRAIGERSAERRRLPTSTRAVAAAKRAFPEWAATDTEKRAEILARAAALIEEHAKELARGPDLRAGQADARGARRGHAPGARRALLRRGGDARCAAPTRSCHRRSGRPTARSSAARWACAPRSRRTTSRSRCWAQGRARAGERQHGGRQAGRHDAAGDAEVARDLRRGRRAGRRAQRRHRPRRRHRRRARRPPRRAPGRVHRLDRGRPARGGGAPGRCSSASRSSSAAPTR